MRRLFWVALGASAGVLLARKVSTTMTRTAEALTPQNIAQSLADSLAILGEAVHDFLVQVRTGMTEREVELSQALQLGEVAERRVGQPAALSRSGEQAPGEP